MIKSYSILITEVDDVEAAVEELNTQLEAVELRKYTVGIVSVHTDYLNSDVYFAVAKAIHIPLVGVTTLTQTACGIVGTYLFSILILTSDTCEFAYGYSDIIPEDASADTVTQDCYRELKKKLSSEVKGVFLYAPHMLNHCATHYIDAIQDLQENVPIFGTLASADITTLTEDAKTFYNESDFNDRLVMLLISGDFSPEFYLGALTKEAVVMADIGEVTKSEGSLVTEINGIPIDEFFEKIGYVTGEGRNRGLLSSVFILDEKDNDGEVASSSVRGLLTMNKGLGIFAGGVKMGSVISIGMINKEIIMDTAKEITSQIKQKYQGGTVLIYSCAGRQYSILDEPMKEYALLKEELEQDFNMIAACSGGEICPAKITDAKIYNSEHNQSIIACVF